MKFPTHRKARVTLRGLVITDGRQNPPDEVGAVFAWTNLRIMGGEHPTAIPFGPDGGRVHHDGRPLLLSFPSALVAAAKSLQRRALRRAFEDGTLDLQEDLNSQRREHLQAAWGGALLLLGGLPLAVYWLASLPYQGLPSAVAWLSWTVSIAMAALPGIGLVAWVHVHAQAARSTPVSLRITPACLHTTDLAGRTSDWPLAGLRRVDTPGLTWRLTFADGRALRLSSSRLCTHELWHLLRDRVHPDHPLRARRAMRNMVLRLVLYHIAAGTAIGVAGVWAQQQGFIPPQVRPIMTGLCIAALPAALAAIVGLRWAGRRFGRRYRARRSPVTHPA